MTKQSSSRNRRRALRPQEAADSLGISLSTLQRLTRSGRIPKIKIGRIVLYRVTTPYSDTAYELYSRITAIESAILQMKALLGPHNAKLNLESHRRLLEKPRWDREARELTWRGMLVREVKRPHHAKNIVAILDAFERAS